MTDMRIDKNRYDHRWPLMSEGIARLRNPADAIPLHAPARPGCGLCAPRRHGRRMRDFALQAGIAFLLGTGICQAEGSEPGMSPLLGRAPAQAFAKSCSTAAPPLPLSRDWATWQGGEPGIAPERMLADAIRVAEGARAVTRDLPQARRMLEHIAQGASSTAPDAKIRLATLLLDPGSGKTDAPRAKKLLAEATMSQRTGAALTMGRLIREGRLPETSMDDAIRYLSIAAGLGDPAAALQLAAIHAAPGSGASAGDNGAHFEALAAINVQTALAAGNCGIAIEVGDYLIETAGSAGLLPAADWFEFAADAGDIRGVTRLARVYEDGEGRPADGEKALALWDRAAEAGTVRALVPAARLRIEAGNDLEKASELLDSAMENGDADAQLLAARLHRGDYDGRSNFAAMHAVLADGTRQADAPVAAIEILANAYMTGQGVEIDLEKADGLYNLILQRGTAEGETIYGRHLIDLGQDMSQAVRHLEAAASGGSLPAAFDLAEIALCRGDANAERMMSDVAASGHAPAFRRLGRLAGDRGDWVAASDLFSKAAERGDRLAMIELAALSGDGKTTDAPDSAGLLRRAAAPGPDMIDGRLALAAAYRAGRFVDTGDEARYLLETIADTARPDVDVEIARTMIKGEGDRDAGTLAERLTRAANAGNGDAMLLLSRLSASGAPGEGATGGPDAKAWLLKAARVGKAGALAQLSAIDEGMLDDVLAALEKRAVCDVPALVQQARLYGLRGNQAAAAKVMETAGRIAQRRNRDLHTLAEAYAARDAGMPNDPAKAAALFETSADRGYAKSTLALAHLLASGRLGDQGDRAIDWYRRAAASGDQSARKELLRYAAGQPDDGTAGLALAALREVAQQGDASVMQAYGSLLVTLRPDSYGEGIGFLEAAARQGDVPAMKTLARVHAAGVNGKVSAIESTQWTRLAAEKGDPEAMFQYAVALDLGFGVEADRKSAQSWHEKAKNNGFVR